MSADYALAYGTHSTPEEGRCAMEWVSYLAGEPHSDQPACVSPVLRAFCTALNDGLDETRAWAAMDWLIRTYTPAWRSHWRDRAMRLTACGRWG